MNRRTVLSGLAGVSAASVGLGSGRAAAAGDPGVSTRAPLDVTTSNALVRGYTSGTEEDFDKVGFEYWELGRKSETKRQRLVESTYEIDQQPVGGFKSSLFGLSPATTYVYRAVGKRSWSLFNRTAYGEPFLLQTPPADANDPVVETLEPADAAGSRVTFRGELADLGDYDSVDLYFQYESPLTFGITRTVGVETDVSEPTTFETTVEGLNPKLDRAYTVTALAVPGDTDRYVYDSGGRVRFEPGDPAPLQLNTGTPTDVGTTEATVGAEITDLGDATAPRLEFAYWPEGDRESARETVAAVPPVATEKRSVEATLDGLVPDAEYVVEATAVTENVPVETTRSTFTTATGSDSSSPAAPENGTAGERATDTDTDADGNATSTPSPDFFWGSDVETLEIEAVDATTATVRGRIDRTPDDYSSLGFEYWPKGERDSVAQTKETVEPPAETGPYETTLDGLKPGTTYVVRAYYRVGQPPFVRDVPGTELEFTTTTEDAAGDPVVRVTEAADASATQATIRGELLDLGRFDRVWVLVTCRNGDEFARGSERVVLDEATTAPKAYEVTVTGLTPNIGYESQVTAIAVSDGTRVEADSQSFRFGTKNDDWYAVRTDTPTDVGATTATVRGTYVDTRQSTDDVTATQAAARIGASRATSWTRLHFRYRNADDSDATWRYWIPDEPILTDPGSVTGTIRGLEPDTTYRVQAVDTLTLQTGSTGEFTTNSE